MRARRMLPLVLLTATIVSCNFMGTGYGSGSGMGSSGGSSGAPSMSGIAFHPSTITISSGATITWTNYDGVAHTVTRTSGPALFADSGDIAPNATDSLMLSVPGTYAYYCIHHAGMTGTIVVQ